MKITSQTSITAKRFGLLKSIEMLAKAGFDGYDLTFFDMNEKDNDLIYSENYLDFVSEILRISKKNDISCVQAHSHFPSEILGDDDYNDESFNKLVSEMEIASKLGAEIIVVHPVKDFKDRTKEFDYNIDFYNKLVPYCKKFNIKVALENMFTVIKKDGKVKNLASGPCAYGAELAEYLDRLDSNYFTACLDIGHSAVVGEEPEIAIKKLGHHRLLALHIQDNDYSADMHTVPFCGNINWDEVCRALGEIDYNGTLNFEAHHFFDNIPDDFFENSLKYMNSIGQYLAGKIESVRCKNDI